jgi:hypothetical protein
VQTISREGLKHVSKLHPQYAVGFVDGEGSFHVAIYKDQRMKTGMKLIPEFHVSQRITSKSVLDRLVDLFECGYVKANHAKSNRDNTYVYVVRDRHDLLSKIIPFFETHPLQTEKQKDFESFAEIVRRMSNGLHRDKDHLPEILDLAYQMNGQGRYRRQRHTL